MKRKVIITTACVTEQGDKFPGDEYTGSGVERMIRKGLARYEAVPEPEPDVRRAQTDSDDAGQAEGEDQDDPDGDQAEEPAGDEPEEAGVRETCQIDGCRKWKLVRCEGCGHGTCNDHMVEDTGLCVICTQDLVGGEGEES